MSFGPALFRELEAESLFDDRRRMEAEVAVVERAVGGRPVARLLDLGCGPAPHHLARLVAGHPGRRAVGVDLTVAFAAMAGRWWRRRSPGPGHFMAGDMRRPGLSPGDFDLVTLFGNSFGYFSHRENAAVMEELARLLALGGTAVLTVPDHRVVATYTPDNPFTWTERATTSFGEISAVGRRVYDPATQIAHGRYRLTNETTGEHQLFERIRSMIYPFDADPGKDDSRTLAGLAHRAGFRTADWVSLPPDSLDNARGLMAAMGCLVLRR